MGFSSLWTWAEIHVPPKPSDWVENHKLDEEGVLLIFIRRAAGEAIQSIADSAGVAYFTVQRILRRLIWKHVDIPQNILTKIPELQ